MLKVFEWVSDDCYKTRLGKWDRRNGVAGWQANGLVLGSSSTNSYRQAYSWSLSRLPLTTYGSYWDWDKALGRWLPVGFQWTCSSGIADESNRVNGKPGATFATTRAGLTARTAYQLTLVTAVRRRSR